MTFSYAYEERPRNAQEANDSLRVMPHDRVFGAKPVRWGARLEKPSRWR